MGNIDFKRLAKEDFAPEEQRLIDKMAFVFNTFAESVKSAFNKNITIDNLNQEIKDIAITVNTSGIPLTTTSFKNNLKNKLLGITCIRAENLTSSNIFPTSGILISFIENNNNVNIQHITGLPSNNRFRLFLITQGS